MLELKSKVLRVPCGSRTLNLVVGDAHKSPVTSISCFGLLQRLYTLFSSSVHHWTILTEDNKLKALSTTGWECRVEAVKAVCYQLPEILKALTALKGCLNSWNHLPGDAAMAFCDKYHCVVLCVVPDRGRGPKRQTDTVSDELVNIVEHLAATEPQT